MLNMIAPLEVGFCVKDMDLMLDFYTRVLGLAFVSSFNVAGDDSAVAGFTPDGYQVVRLQTNYGERIKLVKPGSDPAPRVSGSHVLSCLGNTYLTLIVRDLKATLASLKAAGMFIRTKGEIMEVRDGVYLSIVNDPEGNHLEFVEYRDIKEYRLDI